MDVCCKDIYHLNIIDRPGLSVGLWDVAMKVCSVVVINFTGYKAFTTLVII